MTETNTTMSKDVLLTKRIQDRIKFDRRISNSDVHVLSRSGKVTLIGNVDSPAKKVAAVEIVRTTKGVTSVINQLEVPTEFSREDEEIKNLISRKVQDMVFLENEFISVSVERGTVKLEGVVLTPQKKASASGIVWELSGVRDCQNLIQIKDEMMSEKKAGTPNQQAIIYELNPHDNLEPVTLAL